MKFVPLCLFHKKSFNTSKINHCLPNIDRLKNGVVGDFTVIKSPEKWGFVTYDRVITDCGPGTVIGEQGDDLWVHLDDAPGASCWYKATSEDLTKKHGFRLLVRQT